MTAGGQEKRRPVPRGEERHFFDAAAEGHVGLSRCRSCGRAFLPRAVCPFCFTEAPEPVFAAGLGTVHSFTVCHRAGAPGFEQDVPYVVALVELDEGVRLVSNIVSVPPASVRIGMPVRAVFEDRGEGLVVPLFEPVDDQ
jgi:uncharacterized OB-fold protein